MSLELPFRVSYLRRLLPSEWCLFVSAPGRCGLPGRFYILLRFFCGSIAMQVDKDTLFNADFYNAQLQKLSDLPTYKLVSSIYT
jgi:hypothetical protein